MRRDDMAAPTRPIAHRRATARWDVDIREDRQADGGSLGYVAALRELSEQ